jgi:CBS domain-containing membrane protein
LIGITAANLISKPLLAMPIATSLSILGMFVLRCLHASATAVALIAVIGHVMNYHYAFLPVMIYSVLLVLAGAIYSNMTGKKYPNQPAR